MPSVIGYTYDAAEQCVRCAVKRFGALALDNRTARDREGNEVHAIFSTDEREPNACDSCGEPI